LQALQKRVKVTQGMPRRAGVSSFGIGGTNAHLILEEAPKLELRDTDTNAPWQLLLLSAKSSAALKMQTTNLLVYLRAHPHLNLANIAYTLQVGRRGFNHRHMLVCKNVPDAVEALSSADPERLLMAVQNENVNSIVFLFPGQGTQYVQMACGLYQQHPLFREVLDRCAHLLKPLLGMDMREILLLGNEAAYDITHVSYQLQQTWLTQPVLFVVEYALARLWMSWGVHPQAMIGHSIGEYVAACLAGVFSLEEALTLVVARGRLIQSLPTGAMLAISHPAQEIQPLLGAQLSLAAVNAPRQCVVSGPDEAIKALTQQLIAQDIPYRRLFTSHAFHSAMMDPILAAFTEQVKRIQLKVPQLPYVSNVTGTWITEEQATNPAYWVSHLRQPVHFATGLQTLLQDSQQVLLEVGPGHTLSTFARQQVQQQAITTKPPVILSSLPQANEQLSDVALVLTTLGRLWLAGVKIQWSVVHPQEHLQRIPLPTYPFEHQRYWIDAKHAAQGATTDTLPLTTSLAPIERANISDWFYVPFWKPSLPLLNASGAVPTQKLCWLLFADNRSLSFEASETDIGRRLALRLTQAEHDVILVMPGEHFSRLDAQTYTVNPGRQEDYEALVQELEFQEKMVQRIVHAWSALAHEPFQADDDFLDRCQTLGFYSLLFLVQALEKRRSTTSLHLWIISTNMQHVAGETVLHPEKATLLGLCKVIPQEYPFLRCTSIDLVLPSTGGWQEKKLLDLLTVDLMTDASDTIVAYRDNQRWIQSFEAIAVEYKPERTPLLRDEGIYLITGGLGRIGLVLAKYLAQEVHAKLILLGRTNFPSKSQWADWTHSHDEQNGISQKIKQLEALEDLGAEVLVVSADVADEQHMQAVLTHIDQRFGGLHGVIYAAGIVEENDFLTLHEAEMSTCERHFRAKVRGLLVLEKVLQGRVLDFCLLQSSLSSVLGGLKLGIYAAANLFMDAFAHKQSLTTAIPWISVNWDSWQLPAAQSAQKIAFDTTTLKSALTPQEGVEVFCRLFSLRSYVQVVVSTRPLQTQIDQWITLLAVSRPEVAEQENSASRHGRPNLQNSYVAPRNELEQSITDVWQTLLGIDQIGIYDNFLELGGHSLLAIQLIARLHTAFQVKLHLQDFFNAPTVAGLAKQATLAHQLKDTHPIQSSSRGRNLPLSFSQQRLWFLDQFRPESCLYTIPSIFYLQGNLNVEILEQCLQEILHRHEILRTTFASIDGQGVQIISPTLALPLPLFDLSALERDQKLAEIKRLATQEAEYSFQLTQGPLIRVKLLQLGQADSSTDMQNNEKERAAGHWYSTINW